MVFDIFSSSLYHHFTLSRYYTNKMESTFNETTALWKSMIHRFRIYFAWNPGLKFVESLFWGFYFHIHGFQLKYVLNFCSMLLHTAMALLKIIQFLFEIISIYCDFVLYMKKASNLVTCSFPNFNKRGPLLP